MMWSTARRLKCDRDRSMASNSRDLAAPSGSRTLAKKKPRDLEQQRQQSQQRHEAVNAAAKRDDLMLPVNRVLVGGRQRHDWRCSWREPAPRCGAGHSVSHRRVDALGIAEHFPEAMIITALDADG